MRKILILMCCICLSSCIVFAEEITETCANRAGITITGNNGIPFCRSRVKMNWWTALSWCQKIGMRPFEFPKDCHCEGEKCPVANCPNIAQITSLYAWTSYSNQSMGGMLDFSLSRHSTATPKTHSAFAICAPK